MEEPSPLAVPESHEESYSCCSALEVEDSLSTIETRSVTYPNIPDLYLTFGWYVKKLLRGEDRTGPPDRTKGAVRLAEEEKMIRRHIIECSTRSICSLTVTHACLRRGAVLWSGAGLIVPGADCWDPRIRSPSHSPFDDEGLRQTSSTIVTEGTGFSTDFIKYHTTVTFFNADGQALRSTSLPPSLSSWLVMPRLAASRRPRPFVFLPDEALPMSDGRSPSSPVFDALAVTADLDNNRFVPYQGHSATYYVIQPPDVHGVRGGWRVRRVTQFSVTKGVRPTRLAASTTTTSSTGQTGSPNSSTNTIMFKVTDSTRAFAARDEGEEDEDAVPPVIDYRIDPLEDEDDEPEPGSPLVRVDMANDQLVFLGIHKGLWKGESGVRSRHYEGIALTPQVLSTEFRRRAEAAARGRGAVFSHTTVNGYEASQFSAWTMPGDRTGSKGGVPTGHVRLLDSWARTGTRMLGGGSRHTLPLDDDAPRIETAFRSEKEGMDILHFLLDALPPEDADEHRRLQEEVLLNAAKIASRQPDLVTVRALGRFGLCEAMAKALHGGLTDGNIRLLTGVCWTIAVIAYANENALRLGQLGVIPVMCAQMERLVDAGFEDVEMHYWGMCALRNLCRQQDNRLVFLRWGGLDLVRLLLSSSPRTAFEARLQQAGMVCLLDMAALRKTHQAELSVRLRYSYTAQLIARVILSFPGNEDMRSLCQLVARRLGLSPMVDAALPLVAGWCSQTLFVSPRRDEWWRRRWTIRKLQLQQEEEEERKKREQDAEEEFPW